MIRPADQPISATLPIVPAVSITSGHEDFTVSAASGGKASPFSFDEMAPAHVQCPAPCAVRVRRTSPPVDWDSTVHEPQRLRAGIGFSSVGAAAKVLIDELWLTESELPR